MSELELSSDERRNIMESRARKAIEERPVPLHLVMENLQLAATAAIVAATHVDPNNPRFRELYRQLRDWEWIKE